MATNEEMACGGASAHLMLAKPGQAVHNDGAGES